MCYNTLRVYAPRHIKLQSALRPGVTLHALRKILAMAESVGSGRSGIPFPARRVSKERAREIFSALAQAYPAAKTALDYDSPFTLLIAVILSAQCTDARVNLTTPQLFGRYPTPRKLAKADLADVERIIRSCGFFRTKAKNIIAAAGALIERHGGEVPSDREALESLPGVGRKTANVVLSVAFERATFAVDTHVFRVTRRLGLTLGATPRAVEDDIVALVPESDLRHAHHWLILHGRAICKAPTPLCAQCPVERLCPSPPLVERGLRARRSAGRTAESAMPRRTERA